MLAMGRHIVMVLDNRFRLSRVRRRLRLPDFRVRGRARLPLSHPATTGCEPREVRRERRPPTPSVSEQRQSVECR